MALERAPGRQQQNPDRPAAVAARSGVTHLQAVRQPPPPCLWAWPCQTATWTAAAFTHNLQLGDAV